MKETTSSKKSSGASGLDLASIENQLEGVITKNLPALPDNIIETLVKISPWLAVVGTVMGIPVVLSLLKLNQVASIYGITGLDFGWGYQVSQMVLVVQMVLTGLSIQGLFARKLSAWRLMYYAVWINLLSSLLMSNVISMLISGAISFYILFQVKKSYK